MPFRPEKRVEVADMKLSIDNGLLHVKLEGLEKVWALKSSLSVSLANVTEVRAKEPDEKPRSYWTGLRMPGTFVPWVLKAGTYFTSFGKEFWYVTAGKGFLVLYLKEGAYQRVVLGLDDAEVWAQRVRAAVASKRS